MTYARTYQDHPGLAEGHSVSNVLHAVTNAMHSALNHGVNRIELIAASSRIARRLQLGYERKYALDDETRKVKTHHDTWRERTFNLHHKLSRRQYRKLRRQIAALRRTLFFIRQSDSGFETYSMRALVDQMEESLPKMPRYDGKVDYPSPLAVYAATHIVKTYNRDRIAEIPTEKGFHCDYIYLTENKKVVYQPYYGAGQPFRKLDETQAEAKQRCIVHDPYTPFVPLSVMEEDEIPF